MTSHSKSVGVNMELAFTLLRRVSTRIRRVSVGIFACSSKVHLCQTLMLDFGVWLAISILHHSRAV